MERRDWFGPLLLLGVAGLLFALIGGVYLGGQSASKIQAKIEDAGRLVLNDNGHDWASVKAEGQKLTLSGLAPSEEAKQKAKQDLLSAVGKGGVLSGGVTKVIARDTTVAVYESPFVWSAKKTNSELKLEGFARSPEEINEILEAAKSSFSGDVISSMKVAAGAPQGGDWGDVARFGLAQLAKLETGRASIQDTFLTIEGQAINNETFDELTLALTSVSSPYRAISKVIPPYTWAAQVHDGQMVLTGRAPSDNDRNRLVAAARRSFDGNVSDAMSVGGENGWVGRVITAMENFAKFETGEMKLVDDILMIKGAASESAYEYLSEDMSRVADNIAMQYDVNFILPSLEEIEGLNLEVEGDEKAQACQTAFSRIMDANKIYFASARATISRESGQTLDKLVAVARQCSSLGLVVEGHTDNMGGRDMNVELSENRAASVVEYLIGKGLEPAQITSVGYGPDRPAASNETMEGRAQNRRIEFKVTIEGNQ